MFNRRFKSNLQGSENSNLTLTLPENKQEGLLTHFYETNKTTEQDKRKYESMRKEK